MTEIKAELDSGSVNAAPPNPVFSEFLDKLGKVEDSKQQDDCLRKAKLFTKYYTESLHKHNEQFCKGGLLFLACFGEKETAQIVAKFLIHGEIGDATMRQYADQIYESPINHLMVPLCREGVIYSIVVYLSIIGLPSSYNVNCNHEIAPFVHFLYFDIGEICPLNVL